MNYLQNYLAACFLGIGALVTGASPAFAATAPDLGAAATFAVLGSSTVTCTGVSTITGDVGVSPGSAVTGFPPCIVVGGAIHSNDAAAIAAQAAAAIAYNDLVRQSCTANLTGQDLGGQTLTSGVYCFDSSAQLTGTLNLIGQGPWIFRIGSTLTTASNSFVLVNGQYDCNGLDVFWQIGSSATLGTRTQFIGNILANASITLTTDVNVSGSALALNGAVTMDTNNVSVCNGGGKSHGKCNQGVGNGPEGCDPGNSNQGNPFRSNDELGGVPGNPGRKGGNK